MFTTTPRRRRRPSSSAPMTTQAMAKSSIHEIKCKLNYTEFWHSNFTFGQSVNCPFAVKANPQTVSCMAQWSIRQLSSSVMMMVTESMNIIHNNKDDEIIYRLSVGLNNSSTRSNTAFRLNQIKSFLQRFHRTPTCCHVDDCKA